MVNLEQRYTKLGRLKEVRGRDRGKEMEELREVRGMVTDMVTGSEMERKGIGKEGIGREGRWKGRVPLRSG